MRYLLTKQNKPLSYFWSNGNGKTTRSIIGFKFKPSYFSFNTQQEAENYIEYMKRTIREREIDLKLSIKLFKVFEKVKIQEYEVLKWTKQT